MAGAETRKACAHTSTTNLSTKLQFLSLKLINIECFVTGWRLWRGKIGCFGTSWGRSAGHWAHFLAATLDILDTSLLPPWTFVQTCPLSPPFCAVGYHIVFQMHIIQWHGYSQWKGNHWKKLAFKKSSLPRCRFIFSAKVQLGIMWKEDDKNYVGIAVMQKAYYTVLSSSV